MNAEQCPGVGRPWGTGGGEPICPVCHRGHRFMGAPVPKLRVGRRTSGGLRDRTGTCAVNLTEYHRRLALRNARRARVREESGFTDSPGEGHFRRTKRQLDWFREHTGTLGGRVPPHSPRYS